MFVIRITCISVLLLLSPWASAQGTFETVLNDSHTLVFIAINIGLTAYFTYFRFDRFAVTYGPEVLTTVGILGCFWGIAIALLHFDSSNVTSSVPALLDGVKTAFLASLSGVAGSLVIRFRHRFQKTPIPVNEGASKSASLDDVVNSIQTLQKSLSGSEEGSLLSQMKLIRQEQSDQLTSLRKSFDAFAEKMVEDGSKALIDALREVISDFNAKISEQFGENFKLLNIAVEKLVIWQQQYKDELDRLQLVQKSSSESLWQAASGLTTIVDRSNQFADTASRLEQLLNGLAQQYALIETSQRSLSTVLLEMKDVTPQFSKKLDELADSMKRGVEKVQGDVSDVIRNFGIQAQSSSAEMKQLLSTTLQKSNSEINDQLMKSLDVIRQSVVSLDKGLQEELTKSLETLGRQLASLSEKFVSDYGPLTERLHDVVRIAGQARQ